MKKILSVATLWVIAMPVIAIEGSRSVSMEQYLRTIRDNHPLFTREVLGSSIARAQQRFFEGDEDWVFKAAPFYQHVERSQANAFAPKEQRQLSLNVGAERLFWSNGSHVSVDYDYNHYDQRFLQPTGAYDEHGHGVSVTYSIPLMKNKGGVLNRLDYELQGYNVVLADVVALENQEQFLEQNGQRFIDWVFVTEQLRIAENRLALAEEELARTEKKRRSRLVADVEVLRAQDAVISAEQAIKRIEVQWKGLQTELATQSGDSSLYLSRPQFDLYALQPLPNVEKVMSVLIDHSRLLKRIDVQLMQLVHQHEGIENELEPELDLIARAGLSSDDNEFGDSAKFDQPQYMVGLNFRYPLGQRSAKADVNKVRLQQKQLRAERANVLRHLEAELRNVLVQLKELEAVMALNLKRIDVARQKTQEELRLHNQGRSELTFVIQSRDSEQLAQLIYAENAANYQKLLLRYASLTDSLLAEVQ